MKYTCQCCGYKTHVNEDNSWEICEVCFWQTCPIGNVEVTKIVGPNPISLVEAQHNFIRFGACDRVMIQNVRKPKDDEPKDENWKPFELLYFNRIHSEIIKKNNRDYSEITKYYFECDLLGDVKRQIEILDNGKIYKYDEINFQDENGGFAEKPIEMEDENYLKMEKSDFEKIWDKPFSNKYLVQKFNLTKDWNASWDNIIYNINEEDLKEKGLLLAASNERFVIDVEYNRNPDNCVLNVKEGQLWLERFKSEDITEVVEKTNHWIEIIDKKIIEIQENKTDTTNHIEKVFDIRIRIENQVYPSKLTLWMNYDFGIEKIRNIKLKVVEKTFLIENTFEDYERMLFDLQITLPPNYKIETCFFCKFSNYFVAGNDNFGDLNCFKNCKEVIQNVKTKNDIIDAFNNANGKMIKVEETHFCEDFEKYTKKDYVYKLKVD